jgi:hypothetical protein
MFSNTGQCPEKMILVLKIPQKWLNEQRCYKPARGTKGQRIEPEFIIYLIFQHF